MRSYRCLESRAKNRACQSIRDNQRNSPDKRHEWMGTESLALSHKDGNCSAMAWRTGSRYNPLASTSALTHICEGVYTRSGEKGGCMGAGGRQRRVQQRKGKPHPEPYYVPGRPEDTPPIRTYSPTRTRSPKRGRSDPSRATAPRSPPYPSSAATPGDSRTAPRIGP